MPVYKYGDVWAFKINRGRKQIFRSGFKTKQEAQMSEYALLLKINDAKETKEISMHFLNDEFKHHLDHEYKITTAYLYNLNFNKHIHKFFVDEFLSSVSNVNLIKFMTYLRKLKYKDKQSLVNLLKIYLEFLKGYGLQEINYDLLKLPKQSASKEKEINYYTSEEFKLFESAIDNIYDQLLFNLLYYYGIRIGELRGLQHKDFDLKLNKVFIRRSLTNKIETGERTVVPPKSKSSEREYPLLQHIKELYKKMYPKAKKSDYLFGIGESTVSRRNHAYARACGLKRIRLHDFRHSCASFLINNGMDYLQVASWLGHKSPITTLETYSHLFPSRKQAIASFIDKNY